MRAVLIRSLAVIGAGGVILAGLLYVASTVDTRPPTVVAIRLSAPTGDDDRVAQITTSIEVEFSEPVVTETAEAAVAIDPAVDGSVSWSGGTMRITPADPLELETEYVVTVAEGVRDPAGNRMTELPPPFDFVTAGRPTLVESDPADGADDVTLDQPIQLTFSTLMDTASVEEHLELVPQFEHELRWSGELLEIVPAEPLLPGTEYEVSIDRDAADGAGVSMAQAVSIAFRTIASGLAAQILVPADGVDGIALVSPIAVVFDRPIDPDSVDPDQLTITPEVAGSLDVIARPGDPPDPDGAGSVLRFVPSAPLPPNTTFEVELAAELTAQAGDPLPEPVRWSFTTGAPIAAMSNGIAFVTDRAGIPNVWIMNADGTGQRQVTAGLDPVLDYAVAPDGTSLVVADGMRLIYQRADGSDRRILTDVAHVEFDPAYSPDGQRVAFARADAETGDGMGLWEWQVGGGEAQQLELPEVIGATPAPSTGEPAGVPLRAPRYSPDGQALAFVKGSGWVGILDLPAERLTLAPFAAASPPMWLPDSSGVVLTGSSATGIDADQPWAIPIEPFAAGSGDSAYQLARSGTEVSPLRFGGGSEILSVAADGRIAYADRSGLLRIAHSTIEAPSGAAITEDPVATAALAPGEELAVAVFADGGTVGSIELVGLDDRERTLLAESGSWPQWLP